MKSSMFLSIFGRKNAGCSKSLIIRPVINSIVVKTLADALIFYPNPSGRIVSYLPEWTKRKEIKPNGFLQVYLEGEANEKRIRRSIDFEQLLNRRGPLNEN